MPDSTPPRIDGLSKYAYGCLNEVRNSLNVAEKDLVEASSLLTESTSMELDKKTAQVARAGAILSSAQIKLAKASNEFKHAELDRNLTNGASIWQYVTQFFTSGVFFMLAGLGLISWAQSGMSGHSSLTFVKVILGIALLLYGTGTVSAAKFSNTAETEKYSATIAGGAGALAIIIGAGFVWFPEKIKEAFQGQRKYMRVHVTPNAGGFKKFDDFSVRASRSNKPIPVTDQKSYLELYVPYHSNTKIGESIDVLLELKGKKESDKSINSWIFISFKKNGVFETEFTNDFPKWVPNGDVDEKSLQKNHDNLAERDIKIAKQTNGGFLVSLISDEPQSTKAADKKELGLSLTDTAPPSVDTGGV